MVEECAAAKHLLACGLAHDIAAHEAKQYHKIGRDYDRVDGQLLRHADTQFKQLFIALNFWDGWIDARNHQWLHYDGINESDWPHLARHIVEALVHDAPIVDPLVLHHFQLSSRPALLDRIKHGFTHRLSEG